MYALTTGRASLTERTVIAGREVLLGRIAYMDPGNVATNIQACAK